MGNFILVAGQTGAGKTTGIRTLNPKETVVLRTIKRKLPFPEAKTFIVKDTPEYNDVLKWIDKVNAKASIKNIVITDGTYIMRHEFFRRDKEAGLN